MTSPKHLRRHSLATAAVGLVLGLACVAGASSAAAPAARPTPQAAPVAEHEAGRVAPGPGILPSLMGKPSRSEEVQALSRGEVRATRSSRAFADIWHSIVEIFHWGVVLRLLLGLLLSVVFAGVIAWHPRRATRLDPLSDLEERKALMLLGMVGAVVAALVTAREDDGANAMAGSLAFVIFGIGALMRFRTALDNPKLTGKAILVVVIGIACGLTEWALAVWMTIASFLLIWFLDSHLACRVRITLGGKREANLEESAETARRILLENRCRTKSLTIDADRRRIVMLAHMPSELDPRLLEVALRSAVSAHGEAAEIRVSVG